MKLWGAEEVSRWLIAETPLPRKAKQKKPKKEKYDSQQMYLDSVQRAEKIRQLEEELRLAEEKKERALNEVRDMMYRNSMEDIPLPCQDEAKGDD